ncbi:hypothetical protein JCM3774_003663 [Rhodotorula dairenensis]
MATDTGTGTSMAATHPPDFSEPVSILQPLTYSASSCGYCSTVPGLRSTLKSSKSYGAWAHALSCDLYKQLLDRGWRRSGAYLYKPDMARTCCPQYTISLDASQFRPSRGQRQVLSRFAAFVRNGDRQGQPGWGPPQPSADLEPPPSAGPAGPSPSSFSSSAAAASSSTMPAPAMQVDDACPATDTDTDTVAVAVRNPETERKQQDQFGTRPEKGQGQGQGQGQGKGKKDKGKGKARAAPAPLRPPNADWTELVHAGDWRRGGDAESAQFKHRFEYSLEPASFTEEKYELYKKYQTQVHHEAEDSVSPKGFKRFLVDTPLDLEPTRSCSDYSYGSHHALYRLDGRLIAFAVIDILPRAVSSVYFVWDPEYAAMSLGKISALREAAMVTELEAAGAWQGGGGRYMMGYYIHTCPKMRYKADYQPSFLLDPPTNTYYPWSECKPRLDAVTLGMATFSGPFPAVTDDAMRISPQPSASSSTLPPASAAPITLEKSSTSLPSAPSTSTTPHEPDGDLELADGAPASENVDDDDDDDDELDTDFPSPPPPGCLEPANLPIEVLAEAFVIQRRTLMPLLLSDAWRDAELQQEARELLAAVGDAGRKRLAIFFGR